MNAAMPDRVDFAVVGAQKAGTRALRAFLMQHPQIGLPHTLQEAHFFDKQAAVAARGDYAPYHAMYTEQALSRCTGDITPIYMYRDGCLEGLSRYNPSIKIIALLRDPSERAYSQWIMQTEKNQESRAFLPALLHEARYLRTHGQHPNFSYIQRGFYDHQIARIQALFPPESCLFLRTEELRNHHHRSLERIYRFLGVDDTDLPAPRAVHARDYAAMPDRIRRILVSVFHKDITRLEARLGWDLSAWKAT